MTIHKIYTLAFFIIVTMNKILSQEQKIFNSDKKYFYSAVYTNENNDTLSNEIISIQSTGKKWSLSESQSEVIFSYQNNNTDSIKFYPTLHGKKLNWSSREITGIIEDSVSVWMHPFRQNQYYITEMAPFPDFMKHLASNGKWKATLFVDKGWGKFKGKSKHCYKILSQEDLTLNSILHKDCIKITSKSKHKLGKSTLDYFFHAKNGFVKLDYKFFNKHKLKIELIKIEY